jgi:hypothetical protein
MRFLIGILIGISISVLVARCERDDGEWSGPAIQDARLPCAVS